MMMATFVRRTSMKTMDYNNVLDCDPDVVKNERIVLPYGPPVYRIANMSIDSGDEINDVLKKSGLTNTGTFVSRLNLNSLKGRLLMRDGLRCVLSQEKYTLEYDSLHAARILPFIDDSYPGVQATISEFMPWMLENAFEDHNINSCKNMILLREDLHSMLDRGGFYVFKSGNCYYAKEPNNGRTLDSILDSPNLRIDELGSYYHGSYKLGIGSRGRFDAPDEQYLKIRQLLASIQYMLIEMDGDSELQEESDEIEDEPDWPLEWDRRSGLSISLDEKISMFRESLESGNIQPVEMSEVVWQSKAEGSDFGFADPIMKGDHSFSLAHDFIRLESHNENRDSILKRVDGKKSRGEKGKKRPGFDGGIRKKK